MDFNMCMVLLENFIFAALRQENIQLVCTRHCDTGIYFT